MEYGWEIAINIVFLCVFVCYGVGFIALGCVVIEQAVFWRSIKKKGGGQKGDIEIEGPDLRHEYERFENYCDRRAEFYNELKRSRKHSKKIGKKGFGMDSIKNYFNKHQDSLITLAIVIILDHTLFEGAFRGKIQTLVDKILGQTVSGLTGGKDDKVVEAPEPTE